MKNISVYKPDSIRNLISVYNSNPGSTIIAGGTEVIKEIIESNDKSNIMGGNRRRPESIISVQDVEELGRIIRRERYLEIGASVTLQKILSLGNRVVPRVLLKSILSVGYRSMRNLATIGGGLCTASPDYPPFTALVSLEAKVEIRGKARSRWMAVEEFIVEDGVTQLAVNEIVTRLRIPYGNWNVQNFLSSGIKGSKSFPLINISILARLSKGMIEDIRIAIGAAGIETYRDRKLEMFLVGLRLPLRARENEDFIKKLEAFFGKEKENVNLYIISTAKKMIMSFIENLIFKTAR